MIKVGDLVRIYRHANGRHGGQYVIGIAMVVEEEEGHNTVIDMRCMRTDMWYSAARCDVEVISESR
jgi:hypothetical protein|tara:strand:- start:8988 stop:9185 length:198 start_codon:yes stop_codon:yes gene_type:complete